MAESDPRRSKGIGGDGMVGNDFVVIGGVAGIGAVLDDLDSAAARLIGEGAELVALAPGVLAVAFDPAVLGAGFDGFDDLLGLAVGRPAQDPCALALLGEIETAALRLGGPAGLVGISAELGSLGVRLRVAVAGYRAADEAARRTVEQLQDEFMEVVGALTPVLAVGAGAAELLGVDTAGAADRLAFDHPWFVDTAAGGIEGYLKGLAEHPAFAVVLAAGALRSGTPWPPRSEEEAIRIVTGVSGLVGALDEDRSHRGVEARLEAERIEQGRAGLADLMGDQIDLGREDAEQRVRVVEVPQADGTSAWILELPGTQDWSPMPGDNPFDLSTDVEAMAGEATAAASAAAGVLAAAQRRRGRFAAGDPVMLVGHSQGGILAAALASDADFRASQRVTDVVAFGAPVARFPVPDSVRMLSVEHRQDPVPRLDGGRGPDRSGWITVERDLSEAEHHSAARTHRAAEYAQTATRLDASFADPRADPSLAQWRVDTAAFFGEVARVTDAHLTRLRSDAPAPAGGVDSGVEPASERAPGPLHEATPVRVQEAA